MKNILKILLSFIIISTNTLYATKNDYDNKIKYQTYTIENGYQVTIGSNQKLKKGKNNLSITISKNSNIVSNADVNIIFAFPSILNLHLSPLM